MSKTWFTADPHFNHANIIKYENRPFENTEEMNKEIIKRFNSKVKRQDKLIIAGDFGLGSWEQLFPLVSQINGHKILVMGNHDKKNIAMWMEAGFAEVYRYPIIFKDFLMVSHNPLYVNENMPYVNIFGHVHSHPSYETWSRAGVCVSVERHNYYPVNFDDIMEYFSGKVERKKLHDPHHN